MPWQLLSDKYPVYCYEEVATVSLSKKVPPKEILQ